MSFFWVGGCQFLVYLEIDSGVFSFSEDTKCASNNTKNVAKKNKTI